MKTKNLLLNLTTTLMGFLGLFFILELIFRLPPIIQKTGGNKPALYKWRAPVAKNEFNSLNF
jgi:hypothetical protein